MINRLFFSMTLALFLSTAHAAPDVALQTLDGQPRNVNEIIGHGKWVIVVFWAHDCRICASEIHHMNEFHAAHKDKDAIVLGITIDGAAHMDRARGFATTHKLQFLNLVTEPEAEIVERFGGGKFVGTPTHYFYDPTGRIVGRKIGPLPRADLEEFIDAFNKSAYAKKPAVTP